MSIVRALLVALAAVAVAALVLLAGGHDPAVALAALCRGAVGSRVRLGETLVAATPLCLAGTGVALALRGGMLNIGAEGQFVSGGICAAAVAAAAGTWPAWIAVLAALLAGALGGALPGGLAGVLRVRRHVPEVLSTILLNFVLLELLVFLLQGPMQGATAGGHPETDRIPAAATLPGGWFDTRAHLGCAALALVPAAYAAFLVATPGGLLVRAAGHAPQVVRFAGFALGRIQAVTLLVSGALCGLAGAVHLTGVTHFLSPAFAAGTGYAAIAVALLARLHPAGLLAAALFFGALEAGSEELQAGAGVSAAMVRVIEAVVILGVLAVDRTAREPLVQGVAAREGQA